MFVWLSNWICVRDLLEKGPSASRDQVLLYSTVFTSEIFLNQWGIHLWGTGKARINSLFKLVVTVDEEERVCDRLCLYLVSFTMLRRLSKRNSNIAWGGNDGRTYWSTNDINRWFIVFDLISIIQFASYYWSAAPCLFILRKYCSTVIVNGQWSLLRVNPF